MKKIQYLSALLFLHTTCFASTPESSYYNIVAPADDESDSRTFSSFSSYKKIIKDNKQITSSKKKSPQAQVNKLQVVKTSIIEQAEAQKNSLIAAIAQLNREISTKTALKDQLETQLEHHIKDTKADLFHISKKSSSKNK